MLFPEKKDGGADRDRTCDPHNAIVVLYQLSYDPIQSGRNVNSRVELSKQFFGFVRKFSGGANFFEHEGEWKDCFGRDSPAVCPRTRNFLIWEACSNKRQPVIFVS